MKIITYSFVFLLILVSSCKNAGFNTSDTILARVYDSHLYTSDLEGMVPFGTSTSDSLAMIRNYVDNWIKNQLLLYQAEKNLPEEQKDFSRQLNDYRNSLIIYKYESELINQKLDTLVNEQEVETYYNNNQENFELKDNILQVVFVKIPDDSPRLSKIRTLSRSELEEDLDSLEYYCMRYAEDYEIIDEEWITFNDLLERVPLKVYNPEVYLTNNKFIELHEDSWYYFLNIIGYGLNGSVSPLSLEVKNIRSIILNMRKKMLIKQMQQEIYEQAMENNDFEYY
nr:hypothetical protein [Bacteroidota bacterium]